MLQVECSQNISLLVKHYKWFKTHAYRRKRNKYHETIINTEGKQSGTAEPSSCLSIQVLIFADITQLGYNPALMYHYTANISKGSHGNKEKRTIQAMLGFSCQFDRFPLVSIINFMADKTTLAPLKKI